MGEVEVRRTVGGRGGEWGICGEGGGKGGKEGVRYMKWAGMGKGG